MTSLLDTSVIVRYLLLDPPHLAAHARALIEGPDELAIPLVALAEAGHVLTRIYGIERTLVVDALIELLGRERVRTLDVPTRLAREALDLCRPSNRVSFADALIWAAARTQPDGAVYTFDRRFPQHGIELHVLPERAAGS